MIKITEQQKYLEWKEHIKDEELSADLLSISGNEEEIFDRFYKNLEFGTAGLRGKLGAGTNRMNIFTVRQATQGLANYLLGLNENPSVAIAYDTRHNSELFAREAACVLAASGVKVWIYACPAPTPMLSYAVRERGCDSGIVITASHNPKIYNGYKAYSNDGCQISPEEASKIISEIEKIDVLTGYNTCSFDEAVASKMIVLLPDSFWRRYYARVLKESVDRDNHYKNELNILYTPLNGTGAVPVTTTLSLGSFGNIEMLPEQAHPDSNFTTCPFPNPELPETMEFPIRRAKESGADIVIATDPDCDRIGVASREKDGTFRLFSGNEVGAFIFDFIIRARKEHDNMPQHPVAVSSIVSSPVSDDIAKANGVEMRKVFTGFRFIGKAIAQLEDEGRIDDFIFGYEESCGYMSGSYVRDKDAVNASLMVCEAANYWKMRGMTLGDAMDNIQKEIGFWADRTSNYYFEGADGAEHIKSMMENLRKDPPSEICGLKVIEVTDYLPKSNVLSFKLAENEHFLIRPSGTEPKIKTYSFAKDADKEVATGKLEKLVKSVETLIGI